MNTNAHDERDERAKKRAANKAAKAASGVGAPANRPRKAAKAAATSAAPRASAVPPASASSAASARRKAPSAAASAASRGRPATSRGRSATLGSAAGKSVRKNLSLADTPDSQVFIPPVPHVAGSDRRPHYSDDDDDDRGIDSGDEPGKEMGPSPDNTKPHVIPPTPPKKSVSSKTIDPNHPTKTKKSPNHPTKTTYLNQTQRESIVHSFTNLLSIIQLNNGLPFLQEVLSTFMSGSVSPQLLAELASEYKKSCDCEEDQNVIARAEDFVAWSQTTNCNVSNPNGVGEVGSIGNGTDDSEDNEESDDDEDDEESDDDEDDEESDDDEDDEESDDDEDDEESDEEVEVEDDAAKAKEEAKKKAKEKKAKEEAEAAAEKKAKEEAEKKAKEEAAAAAAAAALADAENKEKTRKFMLMLDVSKRIESLTHGGDVAIHELPPYKPTIPSSIEKAFVSSETTAQLSKDILKISSSYIGLNYSNLQLTEMLIGGDSAKVSAEMRALTDEQSYVEGARTKGFKTMGDMNAAISVLAGEGGNKDNAVSGLDSAFTNAIKKAMKEMIPKPKGGPVLFAKKFLRWKVSDQWVIVLRLQHLASAVAAFNVYCHGNAKQGKVAPAGTIDLIKYYQFVNDGKADVAERVHSESMLDVHSYICAVSEILKDGGVWKAVDGMNCDFDVDAAMNCDGDQGCGYFSSDDVSGSVIQRRRTEAMTTLTLFMHSNLLGDMYGHELASVGRLAILKSNHDLRINGGFRFIGMKPYQCSTTLSSRRASYNTYKASLKTLNSPTIVEPMYIVFDYRRSAKDLVDQLTVVAEAHRDLIQEVAEEIRKGDSSARNAIFSQHDVFTSEDNVKWLYRIVVKSGDEEDAFDSGDEEDASDSGDEDAVEIASDLSNNAPKSSKRKRDVQDKDDCVEEEAGTHPGMQHCRLRTRRVKKKRGGNGGFTES